jgi:hypothetical protein
MDCEPFYDLELAFRKIARAILRLSKPTYSRLARMPG